MNPDSHHVTVSSDCTSWRCSLSRLRVVAAQASGEEVHTDVRGPARLELRRPQVTYYVTFTRFTLLDNLCSKDEAFDPTKYSLLGRKPSIRSAWCALGLLWWRIHRRLLADFTAFLKSEGTEHRLTTHDTHESLNHRLLERVCAVLHHSQLPKSLWGDSPEAISFYILLSS
jgi:hypothetical protein